MQPSPLDRRLKDRPIELDPALRAVLDDAALSLARATRKARMSRKEREAVEGAERVGEMEGEGLRRVRHRELEVLEEDGDEEADTKTRAYDEDRDEDPAHDPFPYTERKSPAASYGSRGIGAVVLPFDLERAILQLISESHKPLLHADAERLFRPSSHPESSKARRASYTPPSYSLHYTPDHDSPRSTSPRAHITARLARARDGTAFAAVVLPAQYAVVRAVLEGVAERLGPEWAASVESVIEWGSGAGAGMWASMHSFQKEVPAEHTPDGDALKTAAADAAGTTVPSDLDAVSRRDNTTCPPEDGDTHPAAALPASGPDTSQPPTSYPQSDSHTKATTKSQPEPVHPDISSPATAQQPPTTSSELEPEPEPEAQQHQQSFGRGTSTTATSLTSYTALEPRAALASIARRLLRAIPLPVDVSFQKSLHPTGTGMADAHPPPPHTQSGNTVALSAFLLNTLTYPEQRQVVRAMWRSGAGVIVIIDDASPAGFRNVADAREELMRLGRGEVEADREADAAIHAAGAGADTCADPPPPPPAMTERDDAAPLRTARGAHVIAPCPHDGPCPLAAHLLPRAGAGRAGSRTKASRTSDADADGPRAGGGRRGTTGMPSAAPAPLCTFTQRLQRPSFVRKTKHAARGEEDVGYAYVVVGRGSRVPGGEAGVERVSEDVAASAVDAEWDAGGVWGHSGVERERETRKAGRVGAVGRWAEEAAREKAREKEEASDREPWIGEEVADGGHVDGLEADGGRVRSETIDGAAKTAGAVPVDGLTAEDETVAEIIQNGEDGPTHDDKRTPRDGIALEALLRAEAYAWPRVILPPLKRSGHVLIDACLANGTISRLTFPRSQGKQIYYDARKARWGDLFPHAPKHRPVVRHTTGAATARFKPPPHRSTHENGRDAQQPKPKHKHEHKKASQWGGDRDGDDAHAPLSMEVEAALEQLMAAEEEAKAKMRKGKRKGKGEDKEGVRAERERRRVRRERRGGEYEG
ncbi:hypothetical protein JB92DRAFT_3102820 [Gautieria morchelliformis]|nr:hypothetical protein JB92DRAFT_3102820 [Gautieria morchelliformis]